MCSISGGVGAMLAIYGYVSKYPRGGKVSILTHAYPHKPTHKSGHPQSPGWQPIRLVSWCLFANKEKCTIIHDCRHWDQIICDVIKQHKQIHKLTGSGLNHVTWSPTLNPMAEDGAMLSTIEELTLKVLNFWKFTSYCSLKPLWSGMGEVVPACTSLTLHPPFPPTVYQSSWLAL